MPAEFWSVSIRKSKRDLDPTLVATATATWQSGKVGRASYWDSVKIPDSWKPDNVSRFA
jgi:hypothetical protein